MKKTYFAFSIIAIIGTIVLLAFKHRLAPEGSPGGKPAIFANGIVSTECDEFGATFTPDGNTCYFTIKSPSTLWANVWAICVSHQKNGQWTEPEIAPFSGTYIDFNPSISPDGSKLFFMSFRPVDGKKSRSPDIWMVQKNGDGWGEPKNIGLPVNTAAWELGCSAAANGTLYFSSTGTTGDANIYYSRLVDGKYQKPDSLGDAINSPATEADPFIAPDESYIIFSSQGRTDGMTEQGASASYPRSDLYISYHKDGKWTPAKSLGPMVNSTAEEGAPFVSRDGKTLYFSSERNFITTPMKKRLTYPVLEQNLHKPGNGLSDIYQVPVSVFMNK